MGTRLVTNKLRIRPLAKSSTGSTGVDEITQRGFHKGRPAAVRGSVDCGTHMTAEFLARRAMQFVEPGAFMAFEETAEGLWQALRPLGSDLDSLSQPKPLVRDDARPWAGLEAISNACSPVWTCAPATPDATDMSASVKSIPHGDRSSH